MTTIHDLAIIASMRGVSLPSGLTKPRIASIICDIAPEEKARAMEIKALAATIERSLPDEFKEYSAVEFRTMVSVFNDVPIEGISYFSSNVKGTIAALRSHMVPFRRPLMNERQKEVVDAMGVTIVNAGPGTGKTTIACEKAFTLSSEGVLLISYTNEAINEIYRRLHLYPGHVGMIGRRSGGKKINVSTIDSIASFVLGKSEVKEYRPHQTDHSSSISAATDAIMSGDVRRFYDDEGKVLFQHVIVDESQDISDDRASLVIEIFKALKMKSLTILGDPRQRLSRTCGQWYLDMWTAPGEQRKVSLNISHRFTNQRILDVTNRLSALRPEYHVQLESSHDLVDEGPITIQGHCSTTAGAAVALTVDPSTRVGSLVAECVEELQRSGVATYMRSDGAFKTKGTLITTIHSVKGKEFNEIMCIGLDDIRGKFSHIPRDEMLSLMYVLHTRARSKIRYISSSSTFSPPEGISDIEGGVLVERPLTTYKPSIRRETPERLVKDHGFIEFMRVNGLEVEESLILRWIQGVRNGVEAEGIRTSASFEVWKYSLEMFDILHTHVNEVNRRLNQKGMRMREASPTLFAVDTEYFPSQSARECIFEVAAVNLNNPYSSLVSTIRGQRNRFASEYTSRPLKLFEESRTVTEVERLFSNSLRGSIPTLIHYVSKVDLAWYRGCDSIDAGKASKETVVRDGLGSSTSSGSSPKLGEYYDMFTTPVSLQPHMTEHVALCDALMLFELYHLGKI